MFDFIERILEGITNFIRQIIILIIIILTIVLLVLAQQRHAKNPYADHSRELKEKQLEAEREAETNAALEAIYDDYINSQK